MVSLDPTSCLADALERGRAVVRQAMALGGALALCALWRVSPLREPEPLVGLLLALGSGALLVDFAFGWAARRRVSAYADELILSGFRCRSTRTPIERAVARRMVWLGRSRTRRRLAQHLRWRLGLAEGSLGLSPGYMRTTVLPPLAPYERQALLAEYPLVSEMAKDLEQGPADPRALVLLWSIVTAPPSLDRATGRAAGEELRRRLRAAHAILASRRADGARPDPGTWRGNV
jgi:hypothetical protein